MVHKGLIVEMRALFNITAAVAALLVVDAVGFGSHYRHTAGRELQLQASLLKIKLKRMVRSPARAAPARPHSRAHDAFAPATAEMGRSIDSRHLTNTESLKS